MNKNIETFICCDKEYNDANIVIFGAPFDSTTSYRPGTRFASKAIRAESIGLETYSPYQDKDLSQTNICDVGDLKIAFGNTPKTLDKIENCTKKILEDNKIPVMIGGEHLVTLGTIKSVVKKYPDLHVIHFDAHTDLREEFFEDTLSHATVIRRVWELVGDGKIFQFGIRSGEKDEFEFSKEHTFMSKFNLDKLDEVYESLKGKPVYFTLDLDILDPSVFPGTGTPEPGGISFSELLDAVIKLNKLNIVGCDINELSPVYDQSGASTIVACKILRELLLAITGSDT